MTLYMISFAIGGLLGDVFFHTLPHISSSSQHGHSHDHDHHIHGSEEGHSHSHDPQQMKDNFVIILGIIGFFLIERITHSVLEHGHGHHHHHHDGHKVKESRDKKSKNKEVDTASESERQREVQLKSFAIISMVGDFIHNVTDGLSIGVAYVANYKMGVITTMAMLFHEIPHEVGDFALLFQLKYSLFQIVGLQLMTSLGAIFGTLIGSYLGSLYMK